jgi:UDPglucose 6-dehydrogenase
MPNDSGANLYHLVFSALYNFHKGVVMRILVVGTGYVGLVTGSCFAEMGHHVLCLDIDKKKIEALNRGEIPIYEPGLKEIVERNVEAGRLSFTDAYSTDALDTEIIFLAVATPSAADGSADLTYIKEAAQSVARSMHHYAVIVNKSTVPVGSHALVKEVIGEILEQRGAGFGFDVVSNPEFLKEGDAVNDFMKPDRIVIGAESQQAIELMKELYSPFNLSHDRLLVMDPASSELTKYASNAMLACRISFMNELSRLCECVGADIGSVRKGLGADRRIGYSFLYAGVGYGGSCFPKDVRALKHTYEQYGLEGALVNAIEQVNQQQKTLMGHKIDDFFSNMGGLEGKKFAIWGLAFKPGTDDMREAPSISLIHFLIAKGARLALYDPVAMKKAQEILPDLDHVEWAEDEYDAAQEADAVVLMTEWKQFRFVDFDILKKEMLTPIIFDGRNQYTPKEMKKRGFLYISMGRALPEASHAHV